MVPYFIFGGNLEFVYTAIITPFNKDLSIDIDAFIRLVCHQEEAGIAGLVIGGTTGEGWSLSKEEVEQLVIAAKAHFPRKIIIGTGSISTKASIENTKKAKALGADAALVIVPYYNLPSEEGVLTHFNEIAKAGLPMIAYHHPKRTGVKLSLSCLKQIAKIPEVIGIKETVNDKEGIEALSKLTTVFCGNDGEMKVFKKHGAKGVISVVSNLFPQETIDFFATDREDLSWNLSQFIEELFKEGNPSGIKAALAKKNWSKDFLRLPLVPLSESGRRHLYEVMENLLNKEIANK